MLAGRWRGLGDGGRRDERLGRGLRRRTSDVGRKLVFGRVSFLVRVVDAGGVWGAEDVRGGGGGGFGGRRNAFWG